MSKRRQDSHTRTSWTRPKPPTPSVTGSPCWRPSWYSTGTRSLNFRVEVRLTDKHTHIHSLSWFPRGDNQCTFCCDVCRVTDLAFTGGVASCMTLELEDTRTESGELRMEQESEDYCQRRQFCHCTYSSKSSRCSMGMVSSNTLKRKGTALSTIVIIKGAGSDTKKKQASRAMLLLLPPLPPTLLPLPPTLLPLLLSGELMRKRVHSLLVNGEAGDGAVGAAGGRSQHLPAGRRNTYRPSAERSRALLWRTTGGAVQQITNSLV